MALVRQMRLARFVGGFLTVAGVLYTVGTYVGIRYQQGIDPKAAFAGPVLFVWGVAMALFPGGAPPEPTERTPPGAFGRMLRGLRPWERILWIVGAVLGIASGFGFLWLLDAL